MGRKSREKRERRARRTGNSSPTVTLKAENRSGRVKQLEAELNQMADGDASFWNREDCPSELRESHLEDVRAFESLSSGPSLFQGLEANGVDLPPPEKLNERQCAEKVVEILDALARVQVFVVGFEQWSPKQAYTKFWEETLWEGCYVEKKTPGGITMIDASHSLTRPDFERLVGDLMRTQFVQAFRLIIAELWQRKQSGCGQN